MGCNSSCSQKPWLSHCHEFMAWTGKLLFSVGFGSLSAWKHLQHVSLGIFKVVIKDLVHLSIDAFKTSTYVRSRLLCFLYCWVSQNPPAKKKCICYQLFPGLNKGEWNDIKPNFLHRNESASSRQPHTCWKTWSPSPLTLFVWLPIVNMELELTPATSLQKLHRHVGVLLYLTTFDHILDKKNLKNVFSNAFFLLFKTSQQRRRSRLSSLVNPFHLRKFDAFEKCLNLTLKIVKEMVMAALAVQLGCLQSQRKRFTKVPVPMLYYAKQTLEWN